jgi:DNA processing protein
MSAYGRQVTEHIFARLSRSLTTVSGFMTGVDACSHETALKNNLATIAVMPCGIDLICPENQTDLYTAIIAAGGIILSEYAGSAPPLKWMYPKRNRIVAGLSKAVLVVESALQSGSLITAKYAHEYKRTVFTVPGNIFNSLTAGNTFLLKNYGMPVDSGADINSFFHVDTRETVTNSESRCQTDALLATLSAQPMSLEALSYTLRLPVSEVTLQLTLLSVANRIVERGGIFYVC